ncbi:MAG: hypothetical protein AAF728_19760, partial [Cyanobacteria bacterium P01_D01_bin.128]
RPQPPEFFPSPPRFSTRKLSAALSNLPDLIFGRDRAEMPQIRDDMAIRRKVQVGLQVRLLLRQ